MQTILKDCPRNKLLFQDIKPFIIYSRITLYHKTIRPDPKFITWGLIQNLKPIVKFETLVISKYGNSDICL